MPTYQFGPFSLDSGSRLLHRGEDIVALTPKAFDLLQLLVKRCGRVVLKDEILKEVWPGDQVVEEWNLTQYIYTLRTALGDKKGKPLYIETVPRRGYRFIATVNELDAERDATRAAAAAPAQPSFKQLTFRRGAVFRARFASDGAAVVYSAAYEGNQARVYLTSSTADASDSRPLDLKDASLLAVSASGEVAVSLNERTLRGYIRSGTLALTSTFSNARPRELLEDVHEAEWSPDGTELAVVYEVEGRSRLEYPVGNVLYETSGWISHPRFSPRGDRLAFIDHPLQNDDCGSIAVIDPGKKAQLLSVDWISAQGLAWSPSGDEVWFTATRLGNARALHAVSLTGEERLIHRMASALTLQDISSEGRVLLTRRSTRVGIICRAPGEQNERDLSWLDWSLARDLSADGKILLFTEAGEGGGSSYGVYIRETDGADAVRLGNGSAMALSPDGKWALARVPASPSQLSLLAVGAGEPVVLEKAPLSYQQWACWFPGGERILFTANAPGRGTQLFVQDIKDGMPRCITPDIEGVHLTTPNAISPDGRSVAIIGPDDKPCLFEIEGGRIQELPEAVAGCAPVRWSMDGRSLYVYGRRDVPAKIELLELATGKSTFWKELRPPDPVGVIEFLRVLLTPDGNSYAYTYTRDLSELYVVEGLS